MSHDGFHKKIGGETPVSVVAQMAGFDLRRSKMLYLSMGVDSHSLRHSTVLLCIRSFGPTSKTTSGAGYRVLETSHPPVDELPSLEGCGDGVPAARIGTFMVRVQGVSKLLVAEGQRKTLCQGRLELSRAIAWFS